MRFTIYITAGRYNGSKLIIYHVSFSNLTLSLICKMIKMMFWFWSVSWDWKWYSVDNHWWECMVEKGWGHTHSLCSLMIHFFSALFVGKVILRAICFLGYFTWDSWSGFWKSLIESNGTFWKNFGWWSWSTLNLNIRYRNETSRLVELLACAISSPVLISQWQLFMRVLSLL